MRIKDLKAGDKVRCFGSTGAYLVDVENVVVDMTHYRDIAYVVNANNVKGTLTDNDEWIFYEDKVSNKKHIAFDKENTKKALKLLSNDVQQKKRFEHLKGNLSRMDRLHGGVITSQSIETIESNEEVVSHEGWAKDLYESRKNIEDNFDKLHQKIYENKSNDVQQKKRFEHLGYALDGKEHDIVNKPSHYTYGKIEIINIVEQVTAAYPTNIAFSIGNALKYICRAPFKNGVEDLKKAVWYLERAIKKWEK